MKNIDFLPESYRRRRIQRRAYAWEISVLLLFGGIVAATALMQFGLRWQVSQRMATLEPSFQQALQTQNRYRLLQAELAKSSEAAELYMFLEHPWPRTQVLHAIVDSLPAQISLTNLHITSEAVQSSATSRAVLSDEALARLSAAQRDLDRLRKDADSRRAIVWIAGITSDASQVHELTQRLAGRPPFESVKLDMVESKVDGGLKQTTFRLRGVLTPGYGQAGGPHTKRADMRTPLASAAQ